MTDTPNVYAMAFTGVGGSPIVFPPAPIAPIASIVEPEPFPPITFPDPDEMCPELLEEQCLAEANLCEWTGEECSPLLK